jgi:23S rRNA (cytidine1920-2'-O)/16S rRNA (cytidine1409-2'-O)-methyltransferase
MKKRLDILLVDLGHAPTRSQAQAIIMAGLISAEGRRLDKPGMMVDEKTALAVKERPRFVSRAGEKLASVAEKLGLSFKDKVVLDVGSSTGGFTDYALQHGAIKVFAVDVGTGQLSYKLRQDERVILMEQTDIRDAALPDEPDIAMIDVSFISLTKILEPVRGLMREGGFIVAMAKPQFEAGKALADKYKGVLPVGEERDMVLSTLRAWILERFTILDEADSGVTGASGNLEHFYLLKEI